MDVKFKENCGNDSNFIVILSILIPSLFFTIILNLRPHDDFEIEVTIAALYTYMFASAIYIYYYKFKWG